MKADDKITSVNSKKRWSFSSNMYVLRDVERLRKKSQLDRNRVKFDSLTHNASRNKTTKLGLQNLFSFFLFPALSPYGNFCQRYLRNYFNRDFEISYKCL